MKCTPSLEHFETKDEPPSLSIPKIIDSKRNGYSNTKRPYIRKRFDKQRVSGYEIQLKSARHNSYRMFL